MKNKKITLQYLVSRRKENFKMLITWDDADLDRMESGYSSAYLRAYENGQSEKAAFLSEKVAQIRAAKDWKIGQTEEACDWIHW